MLLLLEVGRRIGIREIRRDAGGEQAGVGAIESAVFGLFGLLIAFTFSGAITRFDGRRQLVIEETNAIGTARAADGSPVPVQANSIKNRERSRRGELAPWLIESGRIWGW